MPTRFLLAYAAAALTFCTLDGLWLGVLAGRWYRSQLGDLMRPAPRWDAAAGFYLVYLAGLVFFGVLPALESGGLARALAWGGLFGFFTYYTYDMTNLATLRGWPPAVVAVDVAWGTLLGAVASAAGWGAAQRFA